MRIIRIALATFILSFAVFQTTGCQQAPSARVVQVTTLKAVGHSAESAVELSAQLYRDGRITAAQARQVMDLYDNRFIPAFRFAVAAVNANLDSVASPDLIGLANELIGLVASFQTHP